MRDKKKWGDETQDGKKMGRRDMRQKKWGQMTQGEKTMERQDVRQKKNGETRCKTKKRGR